MLRCLSINVSFFYCYYYSIHSSPPQLWEEKRCTSVPEWGSEPQRPHSQAGAELGLLTQEFHLPGQDFGSSTVSQRECKIKWGRGAWRWWDSPSLLLFLSSAELLSPLVSVCLCCCLCLSLCLCLCFSLSFSLNLSFSVSLSFHSSDLSLFLAHPLLVLPLQVHTSSPHRLKDQGHVRPQS